MSPLSTYDTPGDSSQPHPEGDPCIIDVEPGTPEYDIIYVSFHRDRDDTSSFRTRYSGTRRLYPGS